MDVDDEDPDPDCFSLRDEDSPMPYFSNSVPFTKETEQLITST
jgi:hypothetical protein